MNMPDTNRLLLSGMAEAAPAFSHTARGENFLHLPLLVRRRSGTADHLPVTIPERLLPAAFGEGAWVRVEGQLRTYDRYDETGRHLILAAYARRFSMCSVPYMENEITLAGVVCRQPVYRVTPLMREIADVLLCCERAYGRRDYLPVIVWGEQARAAAQWCTGQRLHVRGRFQSRAYDKAMPDDSTEERVAFEVSAAAVQPIP